MPVIWNVRSGKSLFRAESPSGYAKWFGARRGPLTSNLAEAGLFTRSDPELAEPDLQFHFLPVKFWKQAEVDPDVDAFTAADRAGARALARLGAAALGRPDVGAGDRRRLPHRRARPRRPGQRGGEGPRDRLGRPAGRRSSADEWSPGGTVRGREALRASVRDTLESLYHPVGSCRMGTDDAGRGRPAAAGARHRGAAGRRRLGHADAGARQHERADDHARRARGRPDPRPLRRPRPRRRTSHAASSVHWSRGSSQPWAWAAAASSGSGGSEVSASGAAPGRRIEIDSSRGEHAQPAGRGTRPGRRSR